MSLNQEQTDLVAIAIADSTRIHTQLLAEALHRDGGMQVVASAPNSADLLAAVTRVPIDVAIVSHSLDDKPGRGAEVLREMRTLRPHIKGVILLDSSRAQDILDCFRAGAKGIFCKNERLESLSKCIRTVHEGQIWARSADLDLALEALATTPVVRATNQKGLELLSARERQVIQYLAAGMTNSEIARSLGLSHHTVKNYLFRIFDKLGVSNRTELLSLTMNSTRASKASASSEINPSATLQEAAESGSISAQIGWAEELSKANGHPSDPVSAYVWYLLAERNADSIFKKIQEGKNGISLLMSPRQLAEAEQKASEWIASRKKQAALGDRNGEATPKHQASTP
jgi:DNA-binding NarL/FixJ family response regulator